MAEDFSKGLLSSYDASDMTCQFSNVLDALQGTDVNFEIVKSQTVRPLKLLYVHNKAQILKAYIFAQSELQNFAEYTPDYDDEEEGWIELTTKEYAEKVKQKLQDKDALGIEKVEVLIDQSKVETIETIKRIKEESVRFAEKNDCNIGHVFVSVGFRLINEGPKDPFGDEYGLNHKHLLTELEAPLSETTMAHHYNITTKGELLNLPQLVADLTSHPFLSAVLIHEETGDDMNIRSTEIQATDLHSDVKGKSAFMEEGLNHVDGQPSLCYWPHTGLNVIDLCDDIKTLREQLKVQI